MTAATCQQNGQVCGRVFGSNDVQKPAAIGTAVMSMCQTWLGYLAVTIRGLLGLGLLACFVIIFLAVGIF